MNFKNMKTSDKKEVNSELLKVLESRAAYFEGCNLPALAKVYRDRAARIKKGGSLIDCKQNEINNISK